MIELNEIFLRQMMLLLGFDGVWVNLVMMCITTVDYMVVHNGREMGPIIPRCGLRQGDPLLPYLFLICAEGLSSILYNYTDKGLIHDCNVARNALVVSHLFFADDSFLFFKSNMQECGMIKKCLDAYERASGQVVNFQKSSIFFSWNKHDKGYFCIYFISLYLVFLYCLSLILGTFMWVFIL